MKAARPRGVCWAGHVPNRWCTRGARMRGRPEPPASSLTRSAAYAGADVLQRGLTASNSSKETPPDHLPLDPANLPDPRSFARPKHHWQTNEYLKQRRLQAAEKGEVHFVFLEGGGGAGKKDLLWRLSKMGHEIILYPYVSFMADIPHKYDPIKDHNILQVRWNNKIISAMENIAALSKGGKRYKNDLVFVHRSPLSSYQYAQNKKEAQLYLDLVREIKSAFSSTLVLCKADPMRAQERIGERLLVTHEKEKTLRKKLGESDTLARIQQESEEYERYMKNEANQEGIMDELVHTTSAKQAQAQILKLYGVEMNWVWEELKKPSPATNSPSS